MQYANAQNVDTSGQTLAIYPESAATLASFKSSANQYNDPDAYWLPTLDNNAGFNSSYYNLSVDLPQIPRTARFPSIGYLQYVRTGIIPDDEITTAYVNQHGTPFRLLNFNQISDSSQTIHGVTYPDWAMLDLFFMPSSLLSYGSPYEAYAGTRTVTPQVYLGTNTTYAPVLVTYSNTNAINNMFQYGTCGGATSGRINPNGSVVYTTNANIPTPGITRTVPLQALLHGLVVNQTLTGGTTLQGTNDFYVPNLSPGTLVDETNVASAIVSYLTNNPYVGGAMPLRMPAEICNIPAIAGYGPGASVNPTRNDLVRQIVGNLTTQSNTFSVWVEGQSITKSKANLPNGNYGIYEAGDQITGTVRYHFIVERDLDPGTDGVYGNANSSGPDKTVGTLDDQKASDTNPAPPDYFYRIIYAEEIR
jgi:hypothetical protein